jgi:NAD(P)H-dependent flavin oxidoreductase YrpB (nitropropane dioxygenase family)
MLQTKFTELLGCTVPLQQAGMGKIASPALAAAVAKAGGLGMVSGIGAAPPEYVAKILDGLRRSTSGAFGANFIVAGVRESGKLDADFLKVLEVAASRAPVVEFFYETPDPELVELAHAGGALVSWQLGSGPEAAAAERAGCDLIVAQGTEAGGHVRGTIGLLALLGEVLPAVKVPVVAAGGIGTGRAMAAALAAGASAVRVGTRFVASEEAGTHPAYVEKLIAAEAKDTILTEAFSANWPNAPHRVLRSCVEAVDRFQGDVVGETSQPWAPNIRVPVHSRDSFVADKTTTGEFAAMPLWAGESVGGVKRLQPAGEIVRELADEAEALLRSWNH